MPNPIPTPTYNSANPVPANQPTSPPAKKPFLKGKKRKLIFLFALLVAAGLLAYATTQKQFQISNPFNPKKDEVKGQNMVNKDTSELTDETINNISNMTIEEVKEASAASGINPLRSPSLSNTETSKKIYEEIGNSDPQNNFVSYSEYGISPSYIEIKQGDLVTWTNASEIPMNVVGEGWKSSTPRDPGENYTYTFFFLGEYKYKINDTIEGTIVVVK
jgi:plastocyanin